MRNNSCKSFFSLEEQRWYIANDSARGPWSKEACHAGPVTGTIARELELLVTDKQLLRLTVELLKPVPMAGFEITTEFRKQGRMVTTAAATLKDKNGVVVAVAFSLHAQELEVGELPSTKVESPSFEASLPGDFPIVQAKHDLPFITNGIEVRYPPEENNGTGPTCIWMKALPLLETEQPSPFQQLCPLADCGNGISRNMEVNEANFMNPDITIVMYRKPESIWLASRARSFWEPTGLGLAEAVLFDTQGSIGSVAQTLLIQRTKVPREAAQSSS